jgi:hypothetical protein
MKTIKLFCFLLIVLGVISCNSHQNHLEFKIQLLGANNQNDIRILKDRIFELSGETPQISELPNSIFHFKLNSFQDSGLIFQAIQTRGNFEICESFGLLELYPMLVKVNTEQIGSSNLPKSLLTDTSFFAKNNPLFSILMPNTTEESSLSSGNPIIGYVMSKDTSTLFNILNLTTTRLILPRNLKFELGKIVNESVYPIYAKKQPLFDGSNIKSQMFEKVSVGKTEDREDFEINITLKSPYKKLFADLTKRNIQKGLIMSLDNTVLSAPIVQSEVSGGSFIINSNFVQKEALFIATCLKTGVLTNKPIVQDFGFVKNN